MHPVHPEPEKQQPQATLWDEQHIARQEPHIMPPGFRPRVVRWFWLLSAAFIVGGLALWLAAL